MISNKPIKISSEGSNEELSQTNDSVIAFQSETRPLLTHDTLSICSSHKEPHFAGAEIIRDVIIG